MLLLERNGFVSESVSIPLTDSDYNLALQVFGLLENLGKLSSHYLCTGTPKIFND